MFISLHLKIITIMIQYRSVYGKRTITNHKSDKKKLKKTNHNIYVSSKLSELTEHIKCSWFMCTYLFRMKFDAKSMNRLNSFP